MKARSRIEEDTLICEYSGEVNIEKFNIGEPDDDIMILLSSHSSYHSLWIKPSKRGNLARFINGCYLK